MTDSITRKIAKKLYKRTVDFTQDFFQLHEDDLLPETPDFPTMSPKAREIKQLLNNDNVDFGCQQDSVIKVLEILLGESLHIDSGYHQDDTIDFDPEDSKPGLIYKNLDSDQDSLGGTLFLTISNDADDFIDESGDEVYAQITYSLNKFSVPTVEEIENFINNITLEKLGEYIVIV